MSFQVNTQQFEGPLDLMLHLIHEQQLDIFDLDMAVLTEQYIEYLHAMEELHLEVESEYLVELATLIEYKSKKLLPKKADEEEEDLEDEEFLYRDDYKTAKKAQKKEERQQRKEKRKEQHHERNTC